MTLGSELASELEKQLSVETSCVLPGVHVGLVFGFSCQVGVSCWVYANS